MAVVAGLLLQPATTAVLLGAAVVLFGLYLLSSTFRLRKEPPGPRPLPLIGNLLQLDLHRPYQSLYELSKKYGSVFTVHFGGRKVIVLAGYKAVKEALVHHAIEFGDRDISPVLRDLYNGHGIMFANGDSWKEMRRFTLANLHDFGMGKRKIGEKIIEEVQYLTEVFERHGGEPFDTKLPLVYSVANVTSSVLYGRRFDYTDPLFQEMVCRSPRNTKIWYPIIQIYNWCPRLARWLKSWGAVVENVERNKERVRRLVRDQRDTLCAQERRGFVDSFLIRQREESDWQKTFFHEENLVTSVINLFAAGTDTTATTLHWALLLMAKYPHVQERVQEELSQVIGSRQPREEDRKALTYTNAVIHEIQRVANVDPISIPHAASCDVTFRGFSIRKGTRVIPLLMSVLLDESQWESPHSFNPDHFLDHQGRFVRRDAFMPFSAGRRACLGEGLARTELFLIFTSLLQNFSFAPPPGVSEAELDLTPVGGDMLSPAPHKLCAVSRA
ncbi:hypothetical protein SKAU_G00302300 [Synaphobranchus kaupii]|uniref:Cytochrome P450 n=1 Tax=Synaphobranchus kaupii TaxID=118154 RepID=A0A9Q1EW44_SYNKA|nr:hypothetical protein SKAU_G00302300 [Synaphobranchus kaupii]